ncbi:MAG: E3 binding domain-containing protein, partial [Rhodobiaceae bacterium]|nr:E3 binding domain-containing protein [Rhodobiaceae bacterium]
MTTEIRVPALGESVTEATIGQWFRKRGEAIKADEPLVELETDKVTIEVPAPVSGILSDIAAGNGATVEVGALLGAITEGEVDDPGISGGPEPVGIKAPRGDDAAAKPAAPKPASAEAPAKAGAAMAPAPSAAKLMAEKGLDAGQVTGSGKRGQILKEDVLAALEKTAPPAAPAAPA